MSSGDGRSGDGFGSYPRNVSVNFQKLDKASIQNVLKFYGVKSPTNLDHNQLASLTARVFEQANVLEHVVVDIFAAKYCRSLAEINANKKKTLTRIQLDSEPAKIGEQVAAKVLKSNENGSWILGSILEYNVKTMIYEVQDEDDPNRVMTLHMNDVKRLEDSAAHLRRGDHVLAVFPETTSFYRAQVAKTPKSPAHGNASWDVIVRFEDDEDESGKAPPRRIPGRFILKRSYVEYDFDSENEDD